MRRAYIQLHISVLLWGFTGIFGRAIELREVVLVWYRLLITVVVLLAINFFNKKVKRLSSKEILRIGFVGFLVALHWVLFYGAIKYSNVSVGVSCLSTLAVFTTIFESLMTKSRINFAELMLGVMAMVGMYFIFTFQELYRTGIILGIISAIVASIFTILNSRLSKEYDSETITVYELGSGLFCLTLFMPVYIYFAQPEVLFPDSKDWVLLILFGVVCTVIPYNLSLKALKRLSAYTINLSNNLEPVYGIALAFLLFHEQKELTGGFYIGISMIMLSVIVYMILKHRHDIQKFTVKKIRMYK